MEDLRFLKRLLRRTLMRFVRHHKILTLTIIAVAVAYFMLAGLDVRPKTEDVTSQVLALEETTSENIPIEDNEAVIPEELLGTFEAHFIDVGQGDATLICCDGQYMLIDAGDNQYEDYIVNYLEGQNIETLDYVIGTHPDADHVGGLDSVIKNFDCKQIYLSGQTSEYKTYKDVIKAIEKKNYSYNTLNPGTKINLGSAQAIIIGPLKDYDSDNNDSIVIRISYGMNSILITGDAESQSEKDIVEFCRQNNLSLQSNIYKCGHHGSSSSSSQEFLNAVSPENIIISCGKNNKYGHPHVETLQRFKQSGANIYRTDKQGTIIAKVENAKFVFNVNPDTSYKDGSYDTNSTYEGVYILNVKSKKFHTQDCDSVQDISEKNKEISYKTRNELIDEGYSPCGNCHP